MPHPNYVDVIYNPNVRPFTNYPAKLINYLIKRYKLVKNSKLLELGCGRGEFLKEFIDQGMIGRGYFRLCKILLQKWKNSNL